ncbi:hypothetical protein H072_11337 [Dactylellina haptotyla CBS 200.50]|uniref:Uncharacterized protein n=1 Tax=Dactylellina haptotyla (strain CBS 200.50) TaxID=1284197 RepID=S7ZXX8_DACHA|nr:hypothetical protein H072_11337 [Dactylellina haptotyla CBS 200.50]
MTATEPEKPPQYEEAPPVGHSSASTASASVNPQPTSSLQNMIESSGIGDAARRIEGAGEYFRHTLLAQVDRFAGDVASADEKEQLANRGYDQMTTGKRTPQSTTGFISPVTEYYAPEAHAHPTVDTGAVPANNTGVPRVSAGVTDMDKKQ